MIRDVLMALKVGKQIEVKSKDETCFESRNGALGAECCQGKVWFMTVPPPLGVEPLQRNMDMLSQHWGV